MRNLKYMLWFLSSNIIRDWNFQRKFLIKNSNQNKKKHLLKVHENCNRNTQEMWTDNKIWLLHNKVALQ